MGSFREELTWWWPAEDNKGKMSRALMMVNPGWRAMVATKLPNSTMGMLATNTISSSTMQTCRLQILAEQLNNSLVRSRGLVTSAARLSDDKKASDQASLAKKIDPKEAAAKKAAEESTRKALEKKKKDDAKAAEEKKSKKEDSKKEEAEKAAKKAKKEAEEKAEKE